MKIIHVTKSIDPSAGGLPAVPINLGAAQSMLNHDVVLVSCDMNIQGIFDSYWKPYLPAESSIQLQTILPSKFFYQISGDYEIDLRNLISENVIINLHGVWDPVLLAISRFARKYGIPYVVTPHGMLDPWSLRQKFLKKQLALHFGYKKMLEESSFIHVLNVEERQLLLPLKLRSPTKVFPNGVFQKEINTRLNKPVLNNKFPELSGKQYILFLGRLHYKKGLDLLINAFMEITKINKNIQLVIAGPDDGLLNTLEQMVIAGNISEKVHFTGAVYGDDKSRLLSCAACFCLPSYQEGFSMAIIEALAFGIPVVISKQCHFPEVGDVGAGIVVDMDEKKIAKAVDTIMQDENMHESMGESAKKLIMDNYTWEKIARDTIEEYQAIMK